MKAIAIAKEPTPGVVENLHGKFRLGAVKGLAGG
jgi:hypothetical protein